MYPFNSDKLAFVTNDKKDGHLFEDMYGELGWRCDVYGSDCWSKLKDRIKKYKYVLIDLKLGGGLLSTEIADKLLSTGHSFKVFLLASGSTEFLERYEAIVLMKNAVIDTPDMLFRTNGSRPVQMAETAMMKRSIVNGGH